MYYDQDILFYETFQPNLFNRIAEEAIKIKTGLKTCKPAESLYCYQKKITVTAI